MSFVKIQELYDLYRKHPSGLYEFPFSEIVLPAAFTGGKAHWPRS